LHDALPIWIAELIWMRLIEIVLDERDHHVHCCVEVTVGNFVRKAGTSRNDRLCARIDLRNLDGAIPCAPVKASEWVDGTDRLDVRKGHDEGLTDRCLNSLPI